MRDIMRISGINPDSYVAICNNYHMYYIPELLPISSYLLPLRVSVQGFLNCTV